MSDNPSGGWLTSSTSPFSFSSENGLDESCFAPSPARDGPPDASLDIVAVSPSTPLDVSLDIVADTPESVPDCLPSSACFSPLCGLDVVVCNAFGLRPLGSMRCPVAPVGLRPPGSWGRWEGCPFVIIAFVVLDGGSAGAQLSFGRHGELGSMRPVAPVSFRPPGSLGRSEGCPFGRGSAFLALVGGSAGAQFSFGRHRERVAVLVEGCLAV